MSEEVGRDFTFAIALAMRLDGFTGPIERVAGSFAQANATFEAAAAAIRTFGLSFDVMRYRARWADYNAHGRTRPDGRPRRSGHRHRGTAAWLRRHG